MKNNTCSSFILSALLATFLLAGCKHTSRLQTTSSTVNAINPAIKITFQVRKEYLFSNGNLHFSNQFDGARITDLLQVNDSVFNMVIAAENEPINPSPWFAFKVWGAEKRIRINMKYIHAKHRYNPKASLDNGITWTNIKMVKTALKDSSASFNLTVSKDTLLVSAQELMPSSLCYQWIDSLAALPFMHKQIIGTSILGKPIVELNTTISNGKKQVIVLSRQHPPEVTGFMAMQSFVGTVLGNTPLAERFREEYELVMIPLLNPDGVDEGNWRHNLGGVDLNRDWELFQQPETKSAKEYLVKQQLEQQATVYFGIDFHSTFNDVFYTNEDTLTNKPGFTNKWLKAFGSAIPGFVPNVKPSPNGGNVSKSWLMRAFKTDALTYEVGDNTSREMLMKKGRVAAEKMMELLLEN